MKELPRTLASDQVALVAKAVSCRELHNLLDLRVAHLVQAVGETVLDPDANDAYYQQFIRDARDETRAIRYAQQYLQRLTEAVSAVPTPD